MDKNILIGELLYIIIIYYKHNFNYKHWFRRRRNKFILDMCICSNLIDGLSRDIQIDDINDAILCINSHRDDKKLCTIDNNIISISSNEHQKISNIMKAIIIDIISLSKNKFNKNKHEILNLIKAFHNLPRVYVSKNRDTFFNINILIASEDDVIQYAESYLGDKVNKYIKN